MSRLGERQTLHSDPESGDAQSSLNCWPCQILLHRLDDPLFVFLDHVRELQKLVPSILDRLEFAALKTIAKSLVFLSRSQNRGYEGMDGDRP